VLVLGGTGFVGRHVVEAAVAGGLTPTLFDRGLTAPRLFPDLERIRGDRRGDLAAIDGRTFDAVVDLSAFDAESVRRSAGALADRAQLYVLVSSAAAYARLDRGPILEDDALRCGRGSGYAEGKAAAERALASSWHGSSLVVRPGILAGPWDPSGRLVYWPLRLAEGGETVAPAPPQRPVQLLDARDLAVWLVDRIRAGAGGVYNATAPPEPLTFDRFLAACARVVGSGTRVGWVRDDVLVAAQVDPRDLPLWFTGSWKAFMDVDASRAVADGLRARPLDETIRDAVRWAEEHPGASERRGLGRAREAELFSTSYPLPE
jgi:nucleoside-diphosphate-sugar epimerase